MVLSVALLAAVSSQGIDMAYDIRRYKQGAAKSYYRIYVANHTGSHITRISKGENIHAIAPMWLDRNHLAWVEQYDPVPIVGDPNIQYRECKARVMVYDFKNGRIKKLADLPDENWRQYPGAVGRHLAIYRDISESEVKSYKYEVSLKGLKTDTTEVPDRPWDLGTPVGKDTEFHDAPRKATVHFGKQVLKLNWSTPHAKPIGFDDEDALKNSRVELTTEWKGKKSKHSLRGNAVSQSFITKDGTGYLLTEHHYDRSWRPSFLYRFSRDFSHCKLVTKDIGPMILSPDRKLWHGYQPGQDFIAGELLKDGRVVDVTWLYTGDWSTGKQWTIETGLVQAGSCRFRPTK